MKAIHPYLNFNGKAMEAFNFYKSVFGGEFSAVQRFGDIPPGIGDFSADEKEKIMHISLPLGNDITLMASDVPAHMQPASQGSNFHISIQPESREETERLFKGLADGGRISVPLEEAFWGAYFGMLTDRYGVQWMLNYAGN